MSYLLGLSFDVEASPSIRLKAPPRSIYQHRQPFGWGIAWYPSGDTAAMVVKDPTTVDNSALTMLLHDWKRFRSSIFFCHIHGAAKRRTQQDTHPFALSFAGRTWLMAHNGELERGYQDTLPLGDRPQFEPIGRTDSEYAFCWLMNQISRSGARRLADIGWPQLHAWFKNINAQGSANIILTDGHDLVAYRDKDLCSDLYWQRRRPPHTTRRLENDALILDLDDPMDPHRTYCVVVTKPLSDESWRTFQPSQMLVLRRGIKRWSSVPEPDDDTPYTPPPQAITVTASTDPMQQQQGQTRTEDPDRRHIVEPLLTPEPRILQVTHETVYRYRDPVELSTHLLRLQPVHDTAQEILDFELQIEPDGPRSDFEDVFGNRIVRLDVEAPYKEMRVFAKSRVRLQVPTRLSHRLSN